jgi:uncharacterized membrane protein YidH (DUF202 family)
MTPVSRRDRLTDLASLLIILAGIALFLGGAWRLREISQVTREHPFPRGHSALRAADQARYVSNTGMLLTVLGCVVGIGGAVRHARSVAVS